MSLSTATAVQEVHRLAVQQDLTRALRTGEDWQRFNAIARDAAETIDLMQTDFREHYQERLTDARDAILREQNARQFNLPAPGGAQREPLTPEKLDILAMNRVQAYQDRVIAKIRRDEIKAYRDLRAELHTRDVGRSHARALRKDDARDAFNRATRSRQRW